MTGRDEPRKDGYVSTGHLPPAETVREAVREAHDRFASIRDGAGSDVYPALASAPATRFGICLAGVNGRLHTAGDADLFSSSPARRPNPEAEVANP